MSDFLPSEEQRLFDSTVHGLRSQGWSRLDAEAEAIDRVAAARERKQAAALQPKGHSDG